ncbi:MAG: malonyl-ACP O-methyltransferase BioC [Xanthomonadales bacterium]|jgi:malonyl-CoA O-methyltransferase|nr:malonyl-ACP O-methyltransferase BioC [Xanthomonadales bacterium]
MTLTDLDRSAVARAFDRAADTYDAHAALQNEVEDRLLERVPFFNLEPARVLDLGCGTGRGSLALQALFPEAQIVSLDWSEAMLRQAGARRGEGADRVRADMHALPFAPRRFDLVFSSLAVQWSSQEPRLFREVLRILEPGGLFLFSSFGPDTLVELRTAWAAVDPRPRVNQFADMHDIGDALVAAGFQDPVMDMESIVLEYRAVIDLMRDLKAIGATNAARQRAAGLMNRSRLQRVVEAYEPFRRGDRYPASYEVVYGAAFGAPEGRPVRTPDGEVATFSVESLRSGRGE